MAFSSLFGPEKSEFESTKILKNKQIWARLHEGVKLLGLDSNTVYQTRRCHTPFLCISELKDPRPSPGRKESQDHTHRLQREGNGETGRDREREKTGVHVFETRGGSAERRAERTKTASLSALAPPEREA